MKGVSTLASIYKRGKTWAYKVYYYVDGKQKAVSKSGFKTKAEAKDASVKRENEILNGKNFDKEKVLLADYMKSWKKLYKDDTVSVKTLALLQTIINYVEKEFNISLKDITDDNYQTYLNTLAKTRSKVTVQKYHAYTAAAIRHAVKTKVLLHDPTASAVLKGQKDNIVKEENKFIDHEDFRKLEKYLWDNICIKKKTWYIILFSMYTGARFGECLGLTWDCIDFDKKTIRIEKGFDYHFTHDFTEGKTKNSNRTIAAPEKLLQLLSTLPRTKDRVLATTKNITVNKALNNALKHIGVDKHITFHALRHTHASILLSHGVQLLSVSKRLGHADSTITMKTYAHVIKELEKEDNKKINAIFS